MIEIIPDLLIIVFEVFCCKIFYETFGTIRYKGLINIIQIFLLFVSTCIAVFLLSDYFLLRQVAIVVFFSLFMFWHIEISIKKSIVLAVLYDALLVVVDYFVFSIHRGYFLKEKITDVQYLLANYLIALFGKAILFLLVLIVRKKFKNERNRTLQDYEWMNFLLFPIFTIVMISALLLLFDDVKTLQQSSVLFVIAAGMVGMNMMFFFLMNNIMERQFKINENKIFQVQVKNEMEMYRSISENFDKQKRKTHEYKNQIICIESLLAKQQYAELGNYVNKIYGSLNKELDAINTNNVIVNAILNTKYQEALSKDIVFVFKINDLSEIAIQDEDVVTILSNLLNNAIEACEQCENDKIIKIKLVKEDDFTIIAVKNTYNGTLQYENNEIKTTKKENKEEHGVGIKNIIKVIEQYDGSYVIESNHMEFAFSIMIPN